MIRLIDGFVDLARADSWLAALLEETPWRQHEIRMFGRTLPVPRLTAWYGDPGAAYEYSGIPMEILPWSDLMQEIRREVEAVADGERFNSVLVNLYRDGRDSVSWHADDEPELGKEPYIASLSLGATREFRLKPKPDMDLQNLSFSLEHGSLLLMGRGTQERYLHAVPKRRSSDAIGERINLTFRRVLLRD